MRNIKEGDKVTVLVNDRGHELWELVHRPDKGRLRIWFEVLHTPGDTGDMWYLRSVDGSIEIAINPCSASFDGLFKALGVTED